MKYLKILVYLVSLSSFAHSDIQQIKEVINPAKISIRADALKIMDRKMKANDEATYL